MSARAGICGYGVFIPQHRLRVEDIWNAWCHRLRPSSVEQRLGIKEKAVNSWHEDVITMASDAGKAALEMAGTDLQKIKALYMGTCTNPYVTRASMTLVAESLGLGPELMGGDCQFGGKSGTMALQACLGIVAAEIIPGGLVAASDSLSSHVPPNDLPLEYSASAGAAAFIVAREGVIAEIEGTFSYATETADFFRLDGDRYIKRGVSAEDEEIGYRDHLLTASREFMARFSFKPSDFNYAALQQPNGTLPLEVARSMGFEDDQLLPVLLADQIGDCGSASALLALVAALDRANPGERIFLASYGYGAGCDLFCLKVTEEIKKARSRRNNYPTLKAQLEKKSYIDYMTYIRFERKLIQEYI